MDRRGGKSYGPPPGTTLTFFVDDMSMPEPNTWGDQPTLELLRQQLELGGVYFLSHDRRGEMKSIEDVQVRRAPSMCPRIGLLSNTQCAVPGLWARCCVHGMTMPPCVGPVCA